MKFSKTNTDRGTALHLDGDSAGATAHVATFPNTVPFAAQFAAIGMEVDRYGNHLVTLDQLLKPEALTDEARRTLPPVTIAAKAAIQAVQAERRAIAAADTILRAVEPGNSALRSEIRTDWRGRSLAEQSDRVGIASHEELAALMEGGQAVSRLPDAVWTMIEQRYITLNHVKRTGLQADYERKATINELTATGPDEAAAMRAAEAAVERHEARRTVVADAEASLNTIIPFIALATGERVDQAFNRLIA
ncbi:hypothetical protein [Sphingomonas sp. R86520]|uniref:hypothetical protein n=1 Tax=Sphingomonas sp. R86520 TaxID=3093859 RepID=UPI0036D2EFA2